MNEHNENPLVTIVIPAFNHESYVEDAVRSVMAQHYENWELLLIDDGSTDKTGEICDRFAEKDRIRVIHQENMGLSATLNRGLELSKGKYFGFLPSDDLFYPEKLVVQVDLLETHPELAGVGSFQTLVDGQGQPLQDKDMEEWFSYAPASRPDFLLKLLERNFVPAPSMLLKTDMVRKSGGFDTACRFMQDYDLWFRILKNHDMKIIPRPLIYYRWHGGNLTYRATEETEAERGRVFEKAARLLEVTDLYPELWDKFRPEVIALCRADIHQRLSVNPTPNFEEVHGIFDEKFTALWRQRKKLDIPQKVIKRVSPEYVAGTSKPPVIIEASTLDKGGLEQVVHDLAVGMTRRQIPVTVVCVREGGLTETRLREKGIRVEVLPLNDKERAYTKIIKDTGARIINSHYSNFGAGIALELSIPFVSTVHNIYAWLPRFAEGGLRETDPLVCHYIAVSQDVKDYLSERFGIRPGKISVIPNGLDVDSWQQRLGSTKTIKSDRRELGIRETDFLFITPAAINRIKGQDRIIKALHRVVGHCQGAKAILLGPELDSAFSAYLRRLVKDLDLEKHVLFRPYDQNPARWYRCANAFVLPSLIEGWSIAMLEAMYAGLPIIMTNVAGARMVLSEASVGIGVRSVFERIADLGEDFLERFTMLSNDPVVAELSDAMIEVCKNRHRWKEAGEQGKILVRDKYTLASQVQEYERLLFSILVDYCGRFTDYFSERLACTEKALEMSARTIEKVYEGQRQGYWLHTLNQQLAQAWEGIHRERKEQEQRLNELSGEVQRLRAELEAIYSSRGWKLIQSCRKIKGGAGKEGP